MTIELRQRLSETRALHSRGQGIAAEPRQRRWQVENDAVTALRNQGHVAEELNCIANPLLGLQQDGASGAVLSAPARSLDRRRTAGRRAQAPFVFRPAFLELP